jgi:hypothetical protein
MSTPEFFMLPHIKQRQESRIGMIQPVKSVINYFRKLQLRRKLRSSKNPQLNED